MTPPIRRASSLLASATFVVSLCLSLGDVCLAQSQAKRLILKDGSYQLASKYEIHGERVRYYSAERGEWEEVPKSLVDWDATEKYAQGALLNAPSEEAAKLDKELEAERQAEEAKSPQVAPGLRLPPEGGIYLLDTFQNQPQLDELQQAGGELNRNTKSNILRSAVNPLASAKQTVDLPGEHARVQAHTAVPAIYVNLDVQDAPAGAEVAKSEPPPLPPAERFKIVHAEIKGGKRIAGAVKIAPYGKVKSQQKFVPATVQSLTGGWVKVTPTEPLANGEYAVAEMLGKDGMNLYVWDFGVNPNAPANSSAWKPENASREKKPDQPEELKKREPH